MTKPLANEAGRISADTLTTAVAQGVQRALAARATMTELTTEQTEQVSGALVASPVASSLKLRPPIIYGLWYPIDPRKLEAATLNTPQF